MKSNAETKSFEAFNWLSDDAQRYPGAAFAAHVRDMAQGIALAIELVETERLAHDNGDTPVINPAQSGVLTRFAIAAAQSMQREACERVEWMNSHGAEQVRQGTVGARAR